MEMKEIESKTYYEIRPGIHALSYLSNYGFVSYLAQKLEAHPQRMFVELASNIDRHCLVEGQFEKGVLDLLRDTCTALECTDIMIDVGANIGNHSIGLAEIFSEVHSVEPHPVLFHVLQANVLRNSCGNITCYNFGLADEDTSGELVEDLTQHGLGRIKERSVLPPETFGLDAAQFSSSHDVELKSAANFVDEFGEKLNRGFIKIDVEGMEQEILESILPVLHEFKPIVGFEWFVDAQPKLETLARSVPGYKLYGITPHDKGSSLILRALKILVAGRTYTLDHLSEGSKREKVYPLALMIPENRMPDKSTKEQLIVG